LSKCPRKAIKNCNTSIPPSLDEEVINVAKNTEFHTSAANANDISPKARRAVHSLTTASMYKSTGGHITVARIAPEKQSLIQQTTSRLSETPLLSTRRSKHQYSNSNF
jgi:hypothetical protein